MTPDCSGLARRLRRSARRRPARRDLALGGARPGAAQARLDAALAVPSLLSLCEVPMPTRRLAVLTLTLLLTVACASHTAPASDAAVVAALTRQADAWDQAIVRKDLLAIEANMAPDFRQIRSNGQLVDRATFLRDIVAPELAIDPYAVEGLDVRVYGDVALLSGTTHMTGSYAGEAFTTDYRYTDTYVRRHGEWRVVSVQITTIRQ